MKMKTPEISVVRFDAEDILTASGDTTRWSLGSWGGNSLYPFCVFDNNTPPSPKAFTNSSGPIEDGNYNYLDGIGYSDNMGSIFKDGDFYHFDLDSNVAGDIYWNWKTCTDESHHYLAESGK